MKEKEIGSFEIKDKDVAGRIGRLYTPRGYLETPALLPVIDVLRQDVPLEEIRKMGFSAVITNAYLLWRRMRDLAASKGVHGVLGFDGIVMTDSGAYQILQYGKIEATQEAILEFEKQVGSDIAVILDIPTGNARDRRQAAESVRQTLQRAREALNTIDPERRVWTLPIQGGQFLDLLEYSAKESSQLIGKYRLLALGSPTVLLERYDYATLVKMVLTVRLSVPWSVPLHLFGAGHPMIIPFAVALGVDMFDSASYILYARDNRIMTESRTYRLEELDYMPCDTPICVKYTPKELLEMPKQERTRLLALHNLYVLLSTVQKVKQAIREGRLWELLEERSRAHPSLLRAYRAMLEEKSYIEYLVSHSPRLKGGKAKGIFIFGVESLYHPRLIQHNRMLSNRYHRPMSKEKALCIPILEEYKPFTRSPLYRWARSTAGPTIHVVGYALAVGPVPEELAETYPLSQYETSNAVYSELVEETVSRLAAYLDAQKYSGCTIVACSDIEWSSLVAEKLAEEASGITTVTIEVKNSCRGI